MKFKRGRFQFSPSTKEAIPPEHREAAFGPRPDQRGPTHALRLRLEAGKSSPNRSARSMRRNLARLERKGEL